MNERSNTKPTCRKARLISVTKQNNGDYAPYDTRHRLLPCWWDFYFSFFLFFFFFLLFFSFSIFRSCRPFVPAVPCGDAWHCNTFSIKSIVCCRSMPKSMKVHSIPSRLYSSCSRMNMWWLKNCWSFSLVKLMHSCSKLLNCSRPRRGGGGGRKANGEQR